MAEPLRALASSGTPLLGTCAGLIVLDRAHLGVMDIEARRNAFGRQVRSFEADLRFADLEGGRSTPSSSARRGSPRTDPGSRSSRRSTDTLSRRARATCSC